LTWPERRSMAKVVIDANILISPAFGGKPLDVVIKAMGRHEVYVSREIEQELKGVFSKLSGKLTGEQLAFVREKIDQLIGAATLVNVSAHIILSRDAKDDHYLSLCRAVEAEFLITGDKDLLDIPTGLLEKKGIKTRIVNPHQFLEEEIP